MVAHDVGFPRRGDVCAGDFIVVAARLGDALVPLYVIRDVAAHLPFAFRCQKLQRRITSIESRALTGTGTTLHLRNNWFLSNR